MDVLFPVHIILGFATAFALSLAVVPIVIRLATSYGLFDFPDNDQSTTRRIHARPVPRLGGIAIVSSFFITNIIWATSNSFNAIFFVSIAMFAMGLVDDLKTLPAKSRFGIQVICSLIVVHYCHLALPFVALSPHTAISIPTTLGYTLSTFIIVGSINAVNMIDGLDGLAGGIAIISVALLSLVYYTRIEDITLIALLSIPILGAVLGFLKYNTHPAEIFMGDSGSNWLGFMAGVLLLLVLGNFDINKNLSSLGTLNPPAGTTSPYFPFISGILCLAVPIFDTASVIIARLRQGISPMQADRRHFHHTLLTIGLTHSQSVTAIYFLSLSIGILGILPTLFPRYPFSLIPYVTVILLTLLISMRFVGFGFSTPAALKALIKAEKSQSKSTQFSGVMRKWEQFNRYCIYGIFIVSPALAGEIRPEIGYAALAALILVAFSFVLKRSTNDFSDSLIISIGTFVLLIANNQNEIQLGLLGQRVSIQFLYNAIFITLFLSTASMVLLTIKRNYLIFSPSDFLLATLPLLLLVIPEPVRSEYRLDIIALRSLIVFMALRAMVRKRNLAMRKLRVVNAFALSYVLAVSLLGLRVFVGS